MDPVARHAFVRGRVQGVAFRWSTQERATALGVHGWVRNRSDGSVEVVFEGRPSAVEALERWLARGPSAARVDALDVRPADPEGFESFVVERDAP